MRSERRQRFTENTDLGFPYVICAGSLAALTIMILLNLHLAWMILRIVLVIAACGLVLLSFFGLCSFVGALVRRFTDPERIEQRLAKIREQNQ